MSSPIFVINSHLVSAEAMTGTITSSMMDIAELSGFAAHAIFTGAPVGTLSISASNDGTNFKAVGSQAVSGAGQYMLNVDRAHYRYIRVEYAFTSGTGTLDVYVSGKKI